MRWKSAFVVLGLAGAVPASPALAYTKADESSGYRKAAVPKPEHRKVEGLQKAAVADRDDVEVDSPIRKQPARKIPHARVPSHRKAPARE